MNTLARNLSPQEVHLHIKAGNAVLIDIRETDEYLRSHIKGARSYPLSQWEKAIPSIDPAVEVIFMCRSGMRTSSACNRLAAHVQGDAFIMEGGLNAWVEAGLPIERNDKAPLEIMRQVQIAAGLLILSGALMGYFVAPAWFGLCAFVGAGLTFAGISGFCGMARLLMLMPWNRAQLG